MHMKNKKKTASKSVAKKVVESKGFYIALLSLIIMVGFSVYARRLQTDNRNEVSFDDAAWQEAVKESELQKEKEGEMVVEEKKDTLLEDASEKQPELIEEVAVETAIEILPPAEDEKFGIRLPCDGKIIAGCSVEELVYCSSMDDWRTHNGIDIAANEGDSVKAAADGVVSEVYEDELFGVVVVLDHGNGMSTMYGNLQSYDFIRAGTEIKAGDIIGGIGKPGALEADAEPHLHFELRRDGDYENPAQYLS